MPQRRWKKVHLEDALRRAEERLDGPDYAMLKAMAEPYAYLPAAAS